MLFLTIPKPCHENWDEMSRRDKGAFCKVCAKTVIDFTILSDEEVKNYFFQRSGEKTCGRFRNDQLTNTENLLPQLLAASIPFWKKFLGIVLILFSSFLNSCDNETKGKVAVAASQTSATTTVPFEESYVATAVLPDTSEEICMDESDIDVCAITKGFTIPEIIADTSVIADEIIGDLEIAPIEIFTGNVIISDTVRIARPDSTKIDTLGKKVVDKINCDSAKTDSTNFIML